MCASVGTHDQQVHVQELTGPVGLSERSPSGVLASRCFLSLMSASKRGQSVTRGQS